MSRFRFRLLFVVVLCFFAFTNHTRPLEAKNGWIPNKEEAGIDEPYGTESPSPSAEATFTPSPTPMVTRPPGSTPLPVVTVSPKPGPLVTASPKPGPLVTASPTPTPNVTRPPNDTAVTFLAAPKITYAKRLTLTSIKVKWSKASNAAGYELYMSTKPNGGFTKIKTTNATGYVKKKLSKNKKYYFKVRAYSNKGNRVNGNYSETATVEVLSIQKIKNKIMKQKRYYQNGKYWNHVGKSVSVVTDISNYVTNKPCFHFGTNVSSTCNRYYCKASNTIGYQCWGYVDKISDIVFGKNRRIRSHRSFSKLKIGDHIRYQGHSTLVTEKGKHYVKVTEVNYGNTCQIRWGRRITKRELKNAVYYTRY